MTPAAEKQGRDSLSSIDIAVLAGGLGIRIQPVLGETPKVLAPIGGEPFLALLLRWLAGFGAERIVLCLGIGADAVLDWLAGNAPTGLEIVPIVEPEPLGTAGALRFAAPALASNPALVLNGDSFVDADLCAFLAAHRTGGREASLLCCRVPDAARFGRVEIADGGVTGFQEKSAGPGPGPINAGVYLFSQAMLRRIREMPGRSLERDVFQAAAPGTLGAHTVDGTFIDIGTPESLADAEKVLSPFLNH